MKTENMWLSYSKLGDLEYLEDGNRLPNLKEFVKNNCGNLENFMEFCKQEGINEGLFWSTVGTLLIGAKNSGSSNFGSKYRGMVVVTYQNFSSPNLLEFYLIK